MKELLTTGMGISILSVGFLSMSPTQAVAATLIDTYRGNDNANPIEYQGHTYDFWGKYDVDENQFTGQAFLIDLHHTRKGEAKSGTATVESGGAGIYAVKAGNGYALYYTDDLSDISWDTSERGNKGLSHLSIWARLPEETAESIPEPASVLGVFAVGTVAAVGAWKKKLSS